MNATIPGLAPYGLDVVPGHDPDREGLVDEGWRADWFAWRDALLIARDDIHELAEADPEFRADELALCADDPAYWLAVYGWIEEPRPSRGANGLEDAGIKPYAPFAFQADLLRWCDETLRAGKRDGFVSKARGLGASWIFCAWALHGWLFRPAWRVRLISRKEDLVDKPHDLDSLFGKIDFMLNWIPAWQLPAGYNRDAHRLKAMLKNPVTGAQLAGESTGSKSTRGGRATLVVYDEAAFIPDFTTVFGTGAGTTNNRFPISSESFEEGEHWSGPNGAWQTMRRVAPETVKELDYYHNPYFDAVFMEEEAARWQHDPDGFKREYLRDAYAGFGDWIYPDARQMRETDEGYDPTEPLVVSIDPGHADDTAIVFGNVANVDGGYRIRWFDCYERNLMPAEWYAHVLTGIPPEPGDECWGMKISAREDALMAFTRSLPWNSGMVSVVGDPAGSQKHTGISFYDLIATKSLELRRRTRKALVEAGEADPPAASAIVVISAYMKKLGNRHDERRMPTRQLLPFMEVTANQHGRRIKECLSHARFSEPGDKATNEPKPLHNKYSHVFTAVEYGSVYVALGLAKPTPQRAPKPRRYADRYHREAA